ncbi:hypothetical protein MTR67_006961, partial [Solanum verrucosum]
GLRNKARTLISEKEQSELKKNEVPVCQALREEIKLVIKRRSQRIAKQFCDAMLNRPKVQTLRILTTKAERR